jgi:integrase
MWAEMRDATHRTKRSGRHPEKALSAMGIKALKTPGRFADGNGLYLVVDPSGAKRWVLRTVVQGRRRDIGLGSLSLTSLSEARDEAARLRKTARSGGDPLAERRRARRTMPTFRVAAESVHKAHSVAFKNAKHRNQWLASLKADVFPVFGEQPVDQIHASDVLKALAPIWLTKPETARRLRQRIRTVFDWAKASGFRSGDNPVDGIAKVLPKQPTSRHHHAALPFVDVPGFISALRQSREGETVRLAFELMILTATRTSEILNATWDEFDLQKKVWRIPGARMKAGVEYRIPLSERAAEILNRAKTIGEGTHYVFPGRVGEKPLSNMVFLMALRRMKRDDLTAHGFRSSFRDWAAECTNSPRAVCEAALAHTVRDKTEAAYHRTDLFDRRRELMSQWALFAAKQ